MVPAFLSTILFSLSAVSANRLAKMLGGLEANFLRITLAVLFLASWAHSFGQGLSGEALPMFLLSGCVGFGIGDTALYQALPRLGSRLSILLVHCFAAPFAAITEWLWLGTTLTPAQIGWSLVILGGVSMALAPGTHLNATPRALMVGILYGLLAAFGQGFGAVLSRKAYQIATLAGEQIDGLSAAYQRILAGWFIAAVFLLVVKHAAKFKTTNDLAGEPGLGSLRIWKQWRVAWPWIFTNALSGPTLGVGCYQWALLTTPTGIVLPIVAIAPLVVIPFARFMEGEQPSVRSLLGGGIAVAGAVGLTLAQ
ncbi:MAG: EamA family transporter [Verrucomicrobia bacterium]|nr:EamA family transporter [Verrucomicrobiota bacterium]